MPNVYYTSIIQHFDYSHLIIGKTQIFSEGLCFLFLFCFVLTKYHFPFFCVAPENWAQGNLSLKIRCHSSFYCNIVIDTSTHLSLLLGFSLLFLFWFVCLFVHFDLCDTSVRNKLTWDYYLLWSYEQNTKEMKGLQFFGFLLLLLLFCLIPMPLSADSSSLEGRSNWVSVSQRASVLLSSAQ